jgi:hypothetical protein
MSSGQSDDVTQTSNTEVTQSTRNPPIQKTSAEQDPRVPVRPMDIENWKNGVTDLAEDMPRIDAYATTAFGIAIGNIGAIISVHASVATPNAGLMRLMWGLTIAAALAGIGFLARSGSDRERFRKRATRLCGYMDESKRKLEGDQKWLRIDP